MGGNPILDNMRRNFQDEVRSLQREARDSTREYDEASVLPCFRLLPSSFSPFLPSQPCSARRNATGEYDEVRIPHPVQT